MNLRDSNEWIRGLEAAEDYLNYVLGRRDVEPTVSTSGEHPSTKTLRRALLKSDAVGCLLERRETAYWRREDLVESFHLQSDGSPTTGHEVQGVIVEAILRNKEV